MDGGRCFFTKSSVSPGHVAKWLFFMALIQVEGAGEQHAAWRNFTKSFLVVSFLMITFRKGDIIDTGFTLGRYGWII